MSIELNTARILREVKILTAQQARPNDMPELKVLAVTKNQTVESIRAVMAAGITSIGENRVQEAIEKHAVLGDAPEWHFIGHLQTNKARQIPFCQLIHSVDSERLAIEINKTAARDSRTQNVLLQVNVAMEDTKFGIPSGQTLQLARFISSLEHIRLCGCMTIAPLYDDIEKTRPVFHELFTLFQEIKSLNLPNTQMSWLSMGMTNDYRVAIEEGANLIRIGTGIFGRRH